MKLVKRRTLNQRRVNQNRRWERRVRRRISGMTRQDRRLPATTVKWVMTVFPRRKDMLRTSRMRMKKQRSRCRRLGHRGLAYLPNQAYWCTTEWRFKDTRTMQSEICWARRLRFNKKSGPKAVSKLKYQQTGHWAEQTLPGRGRRTQLRLQHRSTARNKTSRCLRKRRIWRNSQRVSGLPTRRRKAKVKWRPKGKCKWAQFHLKKVYWASFLTGKILDPLLRFTFLMKTAEH